MITGNQVYGQISQSTSDAGILVNGAQVTISNNQVHDNPWADIDVNNGAGSTITGDITYNSNYGIEANNASVSGNITYSNSGDGILATGNTIVTGNTAHDNAVSPFGQHTGIELDTGTTGSGNIVFNNKYGIYVVGSGILALNNLAYGNTGAGIYVNGGPDTISGNVIYSNGWGIQLPIASGITIKNDLIYNNSTGGIDIQSGQLSPVDHQQHDLPAGRRRHSRGRLCHQQRRHTSVHPRQHHLGAKRIRSESRFHGWAGPDQRL